MKSLKIIGLMTFLAMSSTFLIGSEGTHEATHETTAPETERKPLPFLGELESRAAINQQASWNAISSEMPFHEEHTASLNLEIASPSLEQKENLGVSSNATAEEIYAAVKNNPSVTAVNAVEDLLSQQRLNSKNTQSTKPTPFRNPQYIQATAQNEANAAIETRLNNTVSNMDFASTKQQAISDYLKPKSTSELTVLLITSPIKSSGENPVSKGQVLFAIMSNIADSTGLTFIMSKLSSTDRTNVLQAQNTIATQVATEATSKDSPAIQQSKISSLLSQFTSFCSNLVKGKNTNKTALNRDIGGEAITGAMETLNNVRANITSADLAPNESTINETINPILSQAGNLNSNFSNG
ncbi:MAG: hypothetical protein JO129_00070 [Candidatus Dependentiae bacterium]|nr:hypothetical protein [Candidatus Dependentiae bacterium]